MLNTESLAAAGTLKTSVIRSRRMLINVRSSVIHVVSDFFLRHFPQPGRLTVLYAENRLENIRSCRSGLEAIICWIVMVDMSWENLYIKRVSLHLI